MKFFNQTLRGFIRKEFRQIFRDPRMRMVLFVAPMIQMTLFGFALSTTVRNIRLAVQYRGPDPVLEHIYQHAIASGWFIPAHSHHVRAFNQIKSNEADAILIAPPGGLTRAIQRGNGRLQILLDATNVTRGERAEAYLKQIIQRVSIHDLKISPPKMPIQFETRILYNPSMRTAIFEVPGVMGMLMCLTTILFTAMSITKEKEEGTFEMLISSPASTTEILMGKSIPFIVLGLLNLPLILAVAVVIFHVPMSGPIWALIAASFVFVCTTVAIGVLISTISQTQQQSMMGGFLFLFPSIQLSGLMFPLENMPTYMKALADINPLAYFLDLLRNIMLKGGDMHLVLRDISILSCMAVILMFISARRFKTRLG